MSCAPAPIVYKRAWNRKDGPYYLLLTKMRFEPRWPRSKVKSLDIRDLVSLVFIAAVPEAQECEGTVRAGNGDVDQEGQYIGEPGVSLSTQAMLGRQVFSALTSSIQTLVGWS